MIFWAIFIGLEIWRNYYLIVKKKIRPNYLGSFMIRAFAAIACLAIMNQDFDLGYLRSWYSVTPDIGFLICSFYLVFDVTLNLLRKLPWDYRGENSGWLDKLPLGYYYALKGLCVVYLVVYFILQ